MEKTSNDQQNKNLTLTLKELDFKKYIPIEDNPNDKEKFKLGKIIVQTKDSNRRVEEKCEVKLYLQKYLCLVEDESMKLFNKDYKQIVAKQIEKMTLEEGIIRKCLLNLFDCQRVWFIVSKDYDIHQFRIATRELKIDDISKYKEYIYYLITIDSIVYPQPCEPKSIQFYDKFIKKYQEEIRYLISKEIYKDSISWCNAICNKFFNMSKDLKKQMTDEIKKKLMPEMKSILLNKTLALMKKPSKENKKDFEDVIKIITKEYYFNFPNEKDDKFIKITARLAQCYLEIRDLENCEKTLKELSLLSKDENVLSIYNSLNELKKQNKSKAKKNILDFFDRNSKTDSLQENAFIWETADIMENINLEANLDFSVRNSLSY